MKRWLHALFVALCLCCGHGVASACTMSINSLSVSPASPSVGQTVTVAIQVSYAQCKGGALQFGDNAPNRLSYSSCAMQSTDWDCANVFSSGGSIYSVYVPGNNGNKAATIAFSYTATSSGSTTLTITDYVSFTSKSVTFTIGGGSPPSASTNVATAVTNSSVTFNGTVSSNGASTTVSFDYGATVAYGSSITASQSPLSSGASGTATSATLSGLTCGTTYNFRVKATNSAGTSYGSNLTVTTSACTAMADYRFDECSVSTAAGQIKDSSGNARHATVMQGAVTAKTSPALINSQADLRDVDGRRYIVPVAPFTLSSNWTVSTWVKFPLSTGGSRYHVLAAVSTGGDLMYMDGGDNYRWGVYTPSNITAGSYQLGGLAAGWHHLAVVGSGTSTSLYVDGSLADTVTNKASGNLAYIGGSYDLDAGTHEGMNALMDEFIVFSGALALSDIQAIRSNQLAGKNWDGSSRASTVCGPSSFSISGTGSASTCSPQTLTITAKDSGGNTLTSYTGTVSLSTSTGKGDWSLGSSPTPAGSLSQPTANSGSASYAFAAGDSGVVKLRLAHSLAQDLTVTVVDASVPASSSTSATIQYRDNAFVWSEDLANKIAGSNVAVAGRNHDLSVSLIKKDAVTGSCGVATDYTGTRNLKLWRTDNGGPWTAPGIVSPALASVPSTRPGSNNLTGLSFTAGVATLSMSSTDIGKYTLNLDDDSLTNAATTISGNTGDLTVRPFALVISGITQGAVNNPGTNTASGTVFAKAGSSFSATVGAYRWSASADSNNDGIPDAGATLAQVTAGGLAPSYNTALTLSPLAASQTPAAGTLGTLNNGSVSGFVGGSKTIGTLQYTEAGSFRLVTTGLVSNYLGTASLNLDALVFNSSGAQSTVIGRFTPAWFTVVAGTQKLRSDMSCSPASSFNYLDEDFEQGLTLTAQNALGATTKNYDDTLGFARLALSTGSVWQLSGIAGTTRFLSVGSPIRLSLASTGSWSQGVSSGAKLTVRALRNPVSGTPDGPFTLKLGIAPQDQDGITMASYDLDTDSPADAVNDRSLIATIPLLFGRLRLQNAIGSQSRNLIMTMQAESWNGASFAPNTLDSCTSIANAQLNFGNLRKSLIAADARLVTSPVTVSSGSARLTLAAPGGGRNGSYDVAVNLGDTVGDASCWTPGWTPNPAASSAAKMSYLRGNWCSSGGSSYGKDPSARATFGLYGSSPNLIYQRENY